MRQGYVVLCVIVVALSGLTGPAVAISDSQPNEGPSSNTGAKTQSTSQSVTDRPASRFSQTSTNVDTESNYNRENATLIDDGEYTSLIANGTDLDYYAVDVSENEELAASIQYEEGEGDIELLIQDSNGNELTYTYDDDGTVSAGVEAGSTDGPYYIVVANDMDTVVEYDLRIETGENATTSYGERFEPNYDRDIATQLGDGEYTSLTADGTDAEYYAVDVSDNEELEAAVEYDSTAGGLELSIEDANGNYLNGSSTDDGTEHATANVGTDETYYIVIQTSGENEIQYNLSINPSVSTPTPIATPTATTEAPTTATPEETVTTNQPSVTQTQTRLPTENRSEDTAERATTVESDDTEPETSSGGSGPGFTGIITISALLISVYIGIRQL